MKDFIIKLEVFWIRQSKFLKCIYTFLLGLIAYSIIMSLYWLPVTKIVVTPEELSLFSRHSVEDWAASDDDNMVDIITVDENGDLVLTFTKPHLREAINDLKDILDMHEREEGIVYNEDYTQIIIDPNKPIEWSERYSAWGMFECMMYQLYNGVDPADISVDFQAVNPETDEVVYHANHPQKIIVFTYYTEDGPIAFHMIKGYDVLITE